MKLKRIKIYFKSQKRTLKGLKVDLIFLLLEKTMELWTLKSYFL